MNRTSINTILFVSIFGIAFAFVEASVVVYLRALYYPGGFSFPLKAMPSQHVVVELSREFATIVMLVAIGIVSGRTRWTRFSYFLIAFGVWDIFYYGWLKVLLNWPATLFDWDILFLIPVPWIGPVIAPCFISALMIVSGILILRKEETSPFQPNLMVWLAGCFGTILTLYAFMSDTDATLKLHSPMPFRYDIFFAGIPLYVIGLIISLRQNKNPSSLSR